MLPSHITYDDREYSDHKSLIFDVWNHDDVSSIYVKGYKDGIVTIEAFAGTNIKAFAEFVEGIFHPKANFALSICSVYNAPVESFKGVHFNFNGVELTVTKENANAKRIYEEWKKKLSKLSKRF